MKGSIESEPVEKEQYAVSLLDIGLWRNPVLGSYLATPLRVRWFGARQNAVRLGWGRKKSGLRAVRIATASNSSFCLLEDGFLRSVGLGKDDAPLSLVFDHKGIYYDSLVPSTLESLIIQPLSPADQQRAQGVMTLWRNHRVSKYNHLPEYVGPLPDDFVLLVDQTFGDASIRYGQGSPEIFSDMLDVALQSHPDSIILIKIHPDVWAGRKKGHFNVATLQTMSRVQVVAEDVHPVRLIEHARAVYVVTSQIGFEAMIWGKQVFTFGMPFYAGYGLTADAISAPARRQPSTLLQLVHAALIRYPRYIDPETAVDDT